ncbi:MAG: glycosyltransferase [Rhodospirillaceae bacterium]|nr:glycosyltransferase [Rhodospirillaceae bacterium]
MTTAGDRDDIGTGRGGILAILPFLVKGALSLIVLRAMRARGLDITVAYTMPEAVGYTRDPLEDFAADERLLDLTAATDAEAVALVLERCARIDARLVLQVGSPIAYRWLPALRQRLPGAALLDILYNPVGHVTNHFLHERTFDGAIVESRAMERFYRENSVHCDPVIHVVESGIDLGHYSMPGSFPERPLTVGWVGRMSPEKNPLGFIRLAEAAHAEMPQLRFAMFGEGPMSDEVRAAVDGSPAHPALSFEGWAESARDCFRAVDILVVPSLLDGRPNAIMEANACGVPVIGAPVGGIPELIRDNENGMLVAPDDVALFLRTLREWADPARLADLRAASRAAAETHFDLDRMMDDYKAVFDRYITDAGTAPDLVLSDPAKAEPVSFNRTIDEGAKSEAAADPVADPADDTDSEADTAPVAGPVEISDNMPPFVCNVCGHTAVKCAERRADDVVVVFCAECGIGTLQDPPRTTDQFYEDGYYDAAENGAVGYYNYDATAVHTQIWVKLLVEVLLPREARILDIGCATGFLLDWIETEASGARLFGIEANDVAARAAEARGITILGDDLLDPAIVPAKAGTFDVITSIATFEHVLDFPGAFERAIRLLSPAGILIYEVPLISAVHSNLDWYRGSFEHITYPTVRGMERLHEELAGRFPGLRTMGFEAPIKGFSSTWIGAAAFDEAVAARCRALLSAMRDPALPEDDETRALNLAFHAVRSFEPTPERVLALPTLLEKVSAPMLFAHLSKLWYADAQGAAQAAYLGQQAENWKVSYDNLLKMFETLREAHDDLQRQVAELRESQAAAPPPAAGR